jgi:hypothetical protein
MIAYKEASVTILLLFTEAKIKNLFHYKEAKPRCTGYVAA